MPVGTGYFSVDPLIGVPHVNGPNPAGGFDTVQQFPLLTRVAANNNMDLVYAKAGEDITSQTNDIEIDVDGIATSGAGTYGSPAIDVPIDAFAWFQQQPKGA